MKPKKVPQRRGLKDERLNKLQRRVARLEKENAQLKKDINTLESYRVITNEYIDGNLDGVPVEKVIKGIDNKTKLKKIKEPVKLCCPKCLDPGLKVIGTLHGKLQLCGNCGYREVIRREDE